MEYRKAAQFPSASFRWHAGASLRVGDRLTGDKRYTAIERRRAQRSHLIDKAGNLHPNLWQPITAQAARRVVRGPPGAMGAERIVRVRGSRKADLEERSEFKQYQGCQTPIDGEGDGLDFNPGRCRLGIDGVSPL
jgi:hypothetical protein